MNNFNLIFILLLFKLTIQITVKIGQDDPFTLDDNSIQNEFLQQTIDREISQTHSEEQSSQIPDQQNDDHSDESQSLDHKNTDSSNHETQNPSKTNIYANSRFKSRNRDAPEQPIIGYFPVSWESKEIEDALDFVEYKMTEQLALIKECVEGRFKIDPLSDAYQVKEDCVGKTFQILVLTYQEAIKKVKHILIELLKIKLQKLDEIFNDEIVFLLDIIEQMVDSDWSVYETIVIILNHSSRYYVKKDYLEIVLEEAKPELKAFDELHEKFKEMKSEIKKLIEDFIETQNKRKKKEEEESSETEEDHVDPVHKKKEKKSKHSKNESEEIADDDHEEEEENEDEESDNEEETGENDDDDDNDQNEDGDNEDEENDGLDEGGQSRTEGEDRSQQPTFSWSMGSGDLNPFSLGVENAGQESNGQSSSASIGASSSSNQQEGNEEMGQEEGDFRSSTSSGRSRGRVRNNGAGVINSEVQHSRSQSKSQSEQPSFLASLFGQGGQNQNGGSSRQKDKDSSLSSEFDQAGEMFSQTGNVLSQAGSELMESEAVKGFNDGAGKTFGTLMAPVNLMVKAIPGMPKRELLESQGDSDFLEKSRKINENIENSAKIMKSRKMKGKSDRIEKNLNFGIKSQENKLETQKTTKMYA